MAEVHWTEIDGIPTAWVEAERRQMASLTFRVGFCDERLATCGRVHLIEHVVGSSVPDPDRLVEASTSGLITTFSTVLDGPAAMTRFLQGVCAALATIDERILEREVSRIVAEQHQRDISLSDDLLAARYGYRGWGLMGAPQLGVETATRADLEQIIARSFTRENAFLSFVGRPPEGLRLELPQGARQPLPEASSVLAATPTHILIEECGGIAVSAVVPNDPACGYLMAIAVGRLEDELCNKGGLSYDVDADRHAVSADGEHITMYADSHPKKRSEMTKRFTEIVTELDTITDDEVDAERRQVIDFHVGRYGMSDDEKIELALGAALDSWLCERPHTSLEDWIAKQSEVGAADVRASARRLQDSLLWVVSDPEDVVACMGPAVPTSTSAPLGKGEEYPSLDRSQTPPELILAAEGITVRDDESEEPYRVDVWYDDIEALMYFDDGGVLLMTAQGADVVIEPTLWFSGREIVTKVRKHVPAELQFGLGEREPEDIPKPGALAL